MASTRRDIRNRLRSLLNDFPYDSAPLAADITAVDFELSFGSDDIAKFKDGYDVEIEEEVCRVTNVDVANGKIQAMRGHLDSEPESHSEGETVRCLNLFSDFELNRHISKAIRSTWPRLWYEKRVVHSETIQSEKIEYELGNANMMRLEVEDSPGSGTYVLLRNAECYRFVDDQSAEHSVVVLRWPLPVGCHLRYLYAAAIPDLTIDAAELKYETINPGVSEFIELQAAANAAYELMARRMRFHEYSVAVAERVADVDAIIRARFAYQNGADVRMADIKRPLPPIWPTRWRR